MMKQSVKAKLDHEGNVLCLSSLHCSAFVAL